MFGLSQSLKSKRGNVTISSMMILAAVLAGMYFLSTKIVTERKMSIALRKNIGANLALRSVTDYIKYGIRKGWCFDPNMLPDVPEKCAGSFTHERSTFRLLMPASYEANLRTLSLQIPSPLPPLGAGDLHLKKIEFITEISKVAPQHPLAKILLSLRGTPVKFVKIQMSRIDDQTLPVAGDEVFIQVGVEFLDDSRALMQDGAEYYRETSRFVTNPREINSFALVVAGNVHLGTSRLPPSNAGHFHIPQVQGTDPYQGLTFDSSVYVNGNILLNKEGYTPVRFNEPVVLGNGQVLDNNGSPFSTGQSLGLKKYWSDLKMFGGFIKGFDSDSKRDAGLDTLAGIIPSMQLNNDIIQQCILIIRASSDLSLTEDSFLTARKLDGFTDLKFTNRYSFSPPAPKLFNIFVPQKLRSLPSATSAYGRIFYSKANFSLSEQRQVFWIDINWYGERIRAPIMETLDGGTVPTEIFFSPYTESEINSAESTYLLKEREYAPKFTAYNDHLKKEPEKTIEVPISPTSTSRKTGPTTAPTTTTTTTEPTTTTTTTEPTTTTTTTAPTTTTTTTAPAPAPTVEIKPNPDWIVWEDERVRLFTPLAALLAEVTRLKDDWLQKKDFRTNSAALKFTMVKPTLGFSKPQSVFREITVEIINPEKFVEKKADFRTGPYITKIPDFLRLEGMDYSASNGRSVRDPTVNPEFNVVYHRFGKDGAGQIKIFNTLFAKDLIRQITIAGADESVDYESIAESCYGGTNAGGGINLDAFQPAGWSTSFTKASEDSWHFASPDPKTTYFDQIFSSNSVVFDVGATRRVCVIKATTDFVAGFYVCQQLVIEDRKRPLDIVGTFIVSRDLTIHDNALKAGIRWANMHNQAAVRLLKAKSILKRLDNSSCGLLPKPFWHPDPGLTVLSDRIRCSSDFLLQGKNPPRWTSIDPDCGRLTPTDTTTKCMKRIRNFNLIQLERVYGN